MFTLFIKIPVSKGKKIDRKMDADTVLYCMVVSVYTRQVALDGIAVSTACLKFPAVIGLQHTPINHIL